MSQENKELSRLKIHKAYGAGTSNMFEMSTVLEALEPRLRTKVVFCRIKVLYYTSIIAGDTERPDCPVKEGSLV